MEDKAMSQQDWDRECFHQAILGLPPPVSCFADGAICPWCGAHHETITFGCNNCAECHRFFVFGFPDWGECVRGRPESFVPFPWKQWDAFKNKANAIPRFVPNDRLKRAYEALKDLMEDDLPSGATDGEKLQ